MIRRVRMSRRVLLPLCAVGVLVCVGPVTAFWSAGGAGSGSATTVTMPTGERPTTSVSGRAITVSFAQSSFQGARLTAAGGGYLVRRYASGSTNPITPGPGCAGTIAGSASTLSCIESDVPRGSWVYRITPVLLSFTGTEGPSSTAVTIAFPAPVLSSVIASNPASGQDDGPIAVRWTASENATGYDVFRRIPGRTEYDFSAPLNGTTPLSGLSFSDTTATGGRTYEYVVRAVDGASVSESSNALSTKVISRPVAPADASATTTAASITVTWTGVPDVAGYNVYRRTATGDFDDANPLNDGSPITATTFTDPTARAGTTYVYGIRSVVTGTGSSQVESRARTSTANASCRSGYRSVVLGQNPTTYYRLGESGGTTAANDAALLLGGILATGSYQGGVTFGRPGALICDTDTAVALNGSSGYVTAGLTVGLLAALAPAPAPDTFSETVWFKTAVGGGRLIGFGEARTGASGRNDRHVYMTDGGRLIFGVSPNDNKKVVTSPRSYADDGWHMATATLGGSGMRLYVDGAEVASDPETKTGRQNTNGWFRAGYDTLAGWPDRPTNPFFAGSLDEVSIVPTQLSADAVREQYEAGRP